MKFREFGTILFVENYNDCVEFYEKILRLPVRNRKETLVTFDLPGGYLMVEQGGVGSTEEKTREENPCVLRFDVDSLETEVEFLEARGVDFSNRKLEFGWGTIAVFKDPDGNRIELGQINEKSGSFR